MQGVQCRGPARQPAVRLARAARWDDGAHGHQRPEGDDRFGRPDAARGPACRRGLERERQGGGEEDDPQATDSANAAAKALTSAQREMGIRWMGVQANLENQKAVDTLKEGEKERDQKGGDRRGGQIPQGRGQDRRCLDGRDGGRHHRTDRGRRHARGPRGRRPRRRRQGRVGKRRHPEGSDGVGEVDRQGGRAGGSHRRERHPGNSRQALLLQGARTHSPPPGDARHRRRPPQEGRRAAWDRREVQELPQRGG